jgi:hypothetical protein
LVALAENCQSAPPLVAVVGSIESDGSTFLTTETVPVQLPRARLLMAFAAAS